MSENIETTATPRKAPVRGLVTAGDLQRAFDLGGQDQVESMIRGAIAKGGEADVRRSLAKLAKVGTDGIKAFAKAKGFKASAPDHLNANPKTGCVLVNARALLGAESVSVEVGPGYITLRA